MLSLCDNICCTVYTAYMYSIIKSVETHLTLRAVVNMEDYIHWYFLKMLLAAALLEHFPKYNHIGVTI